LAKMGSILAKIEDKKTYTDEDKSKIRDKLKQFIDIFEKLDGTIIYIE
jgi:hypothetical protein